jgi:hypothetical protein
MVTRAEVLGWIRRLGLADVFCRLYLREPVPYHLDVHFGCPEELFSPTGQQSTFTEGGLIPLLDDGNFGLILLFDPLSGQFIEKDIEGGGEVQTRYDNWQQYLAELMIRIADSGADDEKLRGIAEMVGFRYLAETLQFLDSCGNLPFDEYHRRKEAFRMQLSDEQ